MRREVSLVLVLALAAMPLVGCGSDDGDDGAGTGGVGAGGFTGGGAAMGTGAVPGGGGLIPTGGGGFIPGGDGPVGGNPLDASSCQGGGPSFEDLRAQAMADNPGVDFTALQDAITYRVAYSGYIDPGYTFKVPFWIQDQSAMNESDWTAYPTGAAIPEADPITQGVNMTIAAPCSRVLIVYSAGGIGGMAELNVTIGTAAQFAAGEERFNNGPDWMLNLPDTFDILNPPMIDPPAPDTRCTACHTEGATQFQIVNTPTQAAKFSDQVLINVFTMGIKPEDPPCFRVLPKNDTIDLQQYYDDFHTWEMTEEQKIGMVLYLRSLTPEGQGDIQVPGMDPVAVDPISCTAVTPTP